MKYDLYLFDFDYTLANSEKGILMCYRYVLDGEGLTEITDDAICRTIGLTLTQGLSILTKSDDSEYIEQLRQKYVAYADTCMTENTKLYPQTLPLLRKIKADGSMTGIISTKFRYRIEDKFSREGASELIDIIIGMEDISEAKPSPEGILKAMERLGIGKGKVLYTGDNKVDALAAQAAGVDFAAVTTGTDKSAVFEVLPHVLIAENLSEIV